MVRCRTRDHDPAAHGVDCYNTDRQLNKGDRLQENPFCHVEQLMTVEAKAPAAPITIVDSTIQRASKTHPNETDGPSLHLRSSSAQCHATKSFTCGHDGPSY